MIMSDLKISARFSILALLLAGLGLLTAPNAARADYPDRVINGIVPFTAGGSADVLARIYAAELSKEFGQPVVVSNKPGAAGNIGVQLVLDAKPDGYTILFCANSMTWNPALYKTLPYDPLKDIIPVAMVAEAPFVIAANVAKFPNGGLAEFVDMVKKNPGKVNISVSGAGLAERAFAYQYGLEWTIIPYNSSTDSAMAVMGGATDLQFSSPLAVQASLQSGKVRLLAVFGDQRLADYPNVATTKEGGFTAEKSSGWFGAFLKPGTPPEIVKRLNAAMNKAATTPEVVQRVHAVGYNAITTTPEQFDTFYRTDIARWKDVVAKANIPLLD